LGPRPGQRAGRPLTGAVLAAALLVGCGGDGADSPRAGSDTTAAPRRALSDADASEAVLTLEDLPAGWSFRASSLDRTGGFCKEFDLGEEVPPAGRARAEFEGGASYLNHVVAVYNAASDATRRMQIVKGGLAKCRRFTADQLSLDLAAATYPKLGDETIAVKGTGKAGDVPVTVQLLFVRTGRVVTSVVGLSGETLAGPRLDGKALEDVARRAEGKAKAIR
jgi:hypothetical protein